jgi:hypothetical protein
LKHQVLDAITIALMCADHDGVERGALGKPVNQFDASCPHEPVALFGRFGRGDPCAFAIPCLGQAVGPVGAICEQRILQFPRYTADFRSLAQQRRIVAMWSEGQVRLKRRPRV